MGEEMQGENRSLEPERFLDGRCSMDVHEEHHEEERRCYSRRQQRQPNTTTTTALRQRHLFNTAYRLIVHTEQ